VKVFDKIIIVLAMGMVVALIGMVPLTRPTNCGGNSAALAVCQMCSAVLGMASDGKGEKFNIHSLSPSETADMVRYANDHWISGSKIFVRTNIIWNSNPKQIVIICGHAYSNVPQPTIWNWYRKIPAHAVAYSDGSTGLITPKQYNELDLSGFIDASQLPTNATTAIP
jgi:hypothetical protein